jgi:murein DD-endopeptidase MepM/ murein hydrolase activator NlpD
MPRHHRRLRLLAPVFIVVVAVVLVVSVATGTIVAPGPPGPVGVVAGANRVVPGQASAPTAAPRIRAEVAQAPLIDASRALPGGAPPISGLTGYRWPLPHARVTLPFGPTPWGEWLVDGRSLHDGVDLATFCGDRIVAAHDGTVLAASRHFDDLLGWVGDLSAYYARLDAKKLWSTLPIVVVIDDGNGYRSIYAHFGKVVVKKGQTVQAGELLGYEGRTGHATGCHLHYGLFSPFERAEFTVDPAIVKRMKVPHVEIARVDPLAVLPPRPTATPVPSAGPTAPLPPKVVIDGGSAGR